MFSASYDIKDDEGWNLDIDEPKAVVDWTSDYRDVEVTQVWVERSMLVGKELVKGEPLDLLDPHNGERPFLYHLGLDIADTLAANQDWMAERKAELLSGTYEHPADRERRMQGRAA